MKFPGLFVLLIFLGSIVYSQEGFPRTYVAFRTVDSIKIDGIANEKSWSKVPFTSDFIDIEGEEIPQFRTNVKMLWDEEYLYFYAEMEEPHVWAHLKQRDTVIFYNNDFEIFIDPDGDTFNYMEFEMNALNTVWDLLLTKPYREGGAVIDTWDISGIRTAVHITGSLNDSSDVDQGWSAEIAMPWKVLEENNLSGKTHEENYWKINFSRVNWQFEVSEGKYSRKKTSEGQYLPEYNWVWSPQYVVNMHEPERWGYVYFRDEPAGEVFTFQLPEAESKKRFLYKMYRSQKQYRSIHGQWATELTKLELSEAITLSGYEIKLETHSAGWNILIIDPSSPVRYGIRENGLIFTY